MSLVARKWCWCTLIYDLTKVARLSFRRKVEAFVKTRITKWCTHHSRDRLTPKTMSREQQEHNDLERRTLIERPRHIVKNIGLLLSLSFSPSAQFDLLSIYFPTESVIGKRLCKPSSAMGITYVWPAADLSCYRISRCETRAKFFEPDIGFCLDLCVLLLKTNHYIIAFIMVFFCFYIKHMCSE